MNLIYCNGCSYSTPSLYPSLNDCTYDYVIQKITGGFNINHASGGSCNRRILRSSLMDIIEQRKLNPDQNIIALIQVTHESRFEIFLPEIPHANPKESNFVSFTQSDSWLNKTKNAEILKNPYIQKYLDGQVYLYDVYAERINLLMDVLLFKNYCESLGIKFLIFAGIKLQTLDQEHVVDMLAETLYTDKRIIEFDSFGFCDWCYENGYRNIDPDLNDDDVFGHYGKQAHKHFAETVIYNKLVETGQI